jgi:hypothetical protein
MLHLRIMRLKKVEPPSAPHRLGADYVSCYPVFHLMPSCVLSCPAITISMCYLITCSHHMSSYSSCIFVNCMTSQLTISSPLVPGTVMARSQYLPFITVKLHAFVCVVLALHPD